MPTHHSTTATTVQIRSYSLRRKLLWVLLIAISAIALLQMTVTYRATLREADAIFDYHMQQVASALSNAQPMVGVIQGPLHSPDFGNLDLVIQVWGREGALLFDSSPRARLPQRAILGFANVRARDGLYRVLSVQSPSQVIQVAQDMSTRSALARNLALGTTWPMAVLAPLLMLIVWWVVSRSMAPLARVERQISVRASDDLSSVSGQGLPSEVQPLVTELNALLSRLQTAFSAQKGFVANAAHELRSPLAALRLQVQALQQASDDEARELAANKMLTGVDRATRLVEQMLMLARQEGANASTPAALQVVELRSLLPEVIADFVMAAESKQIDLGVREACSGNVRGDANALAVLLRNLIENAVKYTPPHGVIDVQLTQQGTQLWLSVEDSGPGIAETEHEQVFERFYRGDAQHVAEIEGNGLGLSIVKMIAQQHGAQIKLDRSPKLGGLRVMVKFPAQAN